MVATLQLVGLDGFGILAFSLVLSVLLVAFGTYVGVLVALQSFFGVSKWAELESVDAEE
jgi:hypothetical protein